ncbi:hypothetical protein IV417_05695 [Alphaproteobacteria bacterium KMM 3653]|uniref:Uncharacterized protein n=1 Tax=Harenicola maris TaxID=2841044 RepID=A0AAP2CM01_9RHOB|nr:hypothetical protein [Harenicola maris]
MIRNTLVCIIACAAPLSALAGNYHCEYVLRCTEQEPDSCVPDLWQASVFDADSSTPTLLAAEESIPVTLRRADKARNTLTFAGETQIGGAESLTLSLTNLRSTYVQKFTLDGAEVTRVFQGDCEEEE